MSPVKVVTDPSSRVGDDPGDRAPGRVGLEALHVGAGHEGDVVLGQDRIDADDLRVRLGVQQAREAVDPVAADARARPGREARLRLVEVDPDRQVEGVEPELLQVVAELLDAGLVGDRRVGVLRAGVALARVLAVLAVHQVEVLGLGVVGLEVVVGDGPGRGDAAVVAQLAEVLRSQPEQGRPVELGVAADVVVDLGLEVAAVPVVPDLRCEVLAADEHRLGLPVVALPGQEVPTFEPEHLRATRGEPVPEGPPSGSRPDDHDVVVLVICHG